MVRPVSLLAHPQFRLPCGFRVPPGGLAVPLSEAHQAALCYRLDLLAFIIKGS